MFVNNNNIMFPCSICDISISTVYKFKQHILTKSHIANLAKQSKPNQGNQLVQIQDTHGIGSQLTTENTNPNKTKYCCKYCSNSYYSNYNLKRHYDTCKQFIEYIEKEKQKLIRLNMIDNIINDVSNQTPQSDTSSIAPPINIIINNNITNNTINGNVNVAICNTVDKEHEFYDFWKTNKVNPVGFENTDMLNNQAIADKIHGGGLNAFIEYIKVVYSNKENHNVGIYNKREKLVKYIAANGNVEITSLDKILDLLVMNNIDGLDVFLDRKDISIRQSYKNIIDRLKFIHEQDGENPYIEKYIRELHLILLNISQSALSKITALESALNDASDELALKKSGLVVPKTDYRISVP
jgi:hypothetical protein